MARTSSNLARKLPTTPIRIADPYWQSDVSEQDLGAEGTYASSEYAGMAQPGLATIYTKPYGQRPRHIAKRKTEILAVSAHGGATIIPLSVSSVGSFTVSSGQVFGAFAGKTALLPYEIAMGGNIGWVEYPIVAFSRGEVPPAGQGASFSIAEKSFASTHVYLGNSVAPSWYGEGGWLPFFFEEESLTQQPMPGFAYSISISNIAAANQDASSLIDAIGTIPAVGKAIATRLRELVAIRTQDEPEEQAMSLSSLI